MRIPCFLAAAALVFGLSSGVHTSAQEVVKRGKKKIEIVWDTYESDHYVIRFEKVIPLATVKIIATELEDILEQYARIFRWLPAKKLEVKFLDSLNTYEQEGGDPSHPGHYNPAGGFLAIRQLPFHQLIPTLYHEAFHQYIQEYVGKDVSIPLWFNEGMATYFEGMQRDTKSRQRKLDPKKIDRRKIRMVQDALRTRRALPLAKLLDATHEEFHDKDKESLYYQQSFALCYFLMQGGGRPIFAYLRELKKTKDPEAALEKIFGKGRKRLKQIETAWTRFVLALKIEKP